MYVGIDFDSFYDLRVGLIPINKTIPVKQKENISEIT
jgi:hypothetical protein